MQISNGLRNHMLDSGSFRGALDGGVIRIYDGTPPASPNDAVPSGATLLCEVTVDDSGTGLSFEADASQGSLLKAAGENWEGSVQTSGTATWFRFVPSADGGLESTSALRFQGTVEQVGGDLNLSSTGLTSGAVQTIDYLSVALPAG